MHKCNAVTVEKIHNPTNTFYENTTFFTKTYYMQWHGFTQLYKFTGHVFWLGGFFHNTFSCFNQ